MRPRHTLLLSALPFAAGAASAAAQPAMGTFAADPAGGRILRFTMSGGPGTRVFASGPPLVRLVAIAETRHPLQGLLAANPGAGAVFLLNETTGAVERTLVSAGSGGLVEPVDAAVDPDFQSRLLVLDGADGTVRRYDIFSGAFLDVAVYARGRASGMLIAEQFISSIFIAYPDRGEVVCFAAESGEFRAITAVGPGSVWCFGSDHSGLLGEDRAGPGAADSVYRLTVLGGIEWRRDLPAGFTPRGVAGSFGRLTVSTGDGIAVIPLPGVAPPVFYPATPGHTTGEILYGGCYADCDPRPGPSNLDILDFICFQDRFARAEPYACGCDTSTGPGVCDLFDFLCFQNWFAFGCS